MEAYSSTVACVLVLFCITNVQGGSFRVRLAESDFRSIEADGMLDVSILISGGSTQEFGDVVFNVTALTKQQFAGVLGEELCRNNVTLPTSASTRPADADDFASTSVTCTRSLGSTSQEITCSFVITQDNILESDEILVVALSVAVDAGNVINLGDNCALAIISPGTSQGLLRVLDGARQVTEGDTAIVYIRIEKDFIADFPVILNVQTGGFGISRGPTQGMDYIFNEGVSTDIVFPADLMILELPLEIIDDNKIEDEESVTVFFNAAVNVPGLDITISPPSITIKISDNDVVHGGFQETREAITLTEGESLNVCVEGKGFSLNNLERAFEIRIEALQSIKYFLSPPQELIALLDFVEVHCIDVITFPDSVPEFTTTFDVTLVDERLQFITDPIERERHMQLNVVAPHTLTIIIQDDDGTPNRPTITKLGAVNKDNLAFEWNTREEGGLRPVVCYYGNVTVRGRQDSVALSTGRETVYQFDLCTSSSPKEVQYVFNDEKLDASKGYEIVVCSRNDLGVNCSESSIFSLPAIQPPTAPPVFTLGPPPPTAPVLGVVPGVIIGIVVSVVLLLCCCLLLLLLFLVFCCSWSREKRYFPQKREKSFAKEKMRHNHDSLSEEEEEYEYGITKTPI